MQGAFPKHPDDRVRRNATIGMNQLPLQYEGEIPFFPLRTPSPRELELWSIHWSFSQAHMWVRQNVIFVIARYVRCMALVEADEHMTVALAHIHSEMRQLEDRLGLSPLALLRLRWEITPDQVEEQRQVRESRSRRLTAVDPKLAAKPQPAAADE